MQGLKFIEQLGLCSHVLISNYSITYLLLIILLMTSDALSLIDAAYILDSIVCICYCIFNVKPIDLRNVYDIRSENQCCSNFYFFLS